VRRHGKHFWFELDRRPWLVVHFGMAGGLHTSRRRSVRLVSSGRRADTVWPPRFMKLHLRLDEAQARAADGRRLGRIRLRRNPRGSLIAALGSTRSQLRLPARFPRACAGTRARSRRSCSTSRSPRASGTGSPTRCSIRRASRPGARPDRCPTGSSTGCEPGCARSFGLRSERGPTATATRDRGCSTGAGTAARASPCEATPSRLF
jgi:hypothetical protein